MKRLDVDELRLQVNAIMGEVIQTGGREQHLLSTD